MRNHGLSWSNSANPAAINYSIMVGYYPKLAQEDEPPECFSYRKLYILVAIFCSCIWLYRALQVEFLKFPKESLLTTTRLHRPFYQPTTDLPVDGFRES